MNLKMMREDLHITQAQMAKQLGMTPSGYAKIERRETPIPDARIKDLARILNIPLRAFVLMIAEDFIDELLKNISALK